MGLSKYWQKRDFDITPEPRGSMVASGKELAFYIQKHHARRLHYDFRLELNGSLKSWAIPKGPSLDPKDKRLAVHVEDHPMSYGTFEGDIPAHQYGAGHVLLWDRGTWEPIGDPAQSYKDGSMKFRLHGVKLAGKWALVRMKSAAVKSDKENWLLIKEKDEEAKTGDEAEVTENHPESVKHLSGKQKTILEEKPPTITSPPEEAMQTPMPESYQPQLATLAAKAPASDEWLVEIKYDGYRALTRIDHGKVAMYSRNGNDWSKKWGDLVKALKKLEVSQAWLDGEVVALAEDGSISFQELQNAARLGKKVRLAYFIFDLMYLNGHDLTQLPLIDRKELLKTMLDKVDPASGLYYSPHIEGSAQDSFQDACTHRMEGVVVKRKDGEYHQFRSNDWLKVKCSQRQEFVIAGYTDPAGSRERFGALLLGVYDAEGALRYAGRVGTGFDAESLAAIAKLTAKLHRPDPAFVDPPTGQSAHGVHWLEPKLVAEVQFAQWTDSGLIRHSSFLALRSDKPATEIVHERPLNGKQVEALAKPEPSSRPSSTNAIENIAGVRLTHPSKVLIAEGEVTKHDLASYYQHVEQWILPHLIDRPLSIVRCPDGTDKECFFQKHATSMADTAIQRIVVPTSAKDKEYMLANDLPAIISLVQMGVLELHTWGASKGHLDKPDRLIFDLDPDEGLEWQYVIDAAQLTKGLLSEIGLESFLKTSGGKGLHVVVPIVPQHDWATIKNFTKAFAAHMEKQIPDRFTANISKNKRHGKIFIDYLRNGSGATAIAAFSTRTKPHATVSMPIFWDELQSGIKNESFTIATAPKRLDRLKEDPWKDYWRLKQKISSKMLALFEPS
ncbi:MAG TPA: DNA ligase D [Methylophilaceae bacterium]